jgi:hypothetical protein
MTLVLYCRVFFDISEGWNPARRQLYNGAAVALFSLLLHGIAISGLLWQALK